MAGMEASWWLNEQLEAWLGERNAADTLAQSAPHNVTSEMGLALLDVADVIRPHPDVVAFLHEVDGEGFLDQLPELAGGQEAREAIRAYLDRYGMRCVGEIDITRPRWSERPTTLVPVILGNVEDFAPGAGPRRFEHGREEAERKERELLARLRDLPDGDAEGGRDEADDRPCPDLQRLPGVPEVRHGGPLLRLQAGVAAGGRPARAGRRAPCPGRHLLPHVRGAAGGRPHEPDRSRADPPAPGRVHVVSSTHATARAHL